MLRSTCSIRPWFVLCCIPAPRSIFLVRSKTKKCAWLLSKVRNVEFGFQSHDAGWREQRRHPRRTEGRLQTACNRIQHTRFSLKAVFSKPLISSQHYISWINAIMPIEDAIRASPQQEPGTARVAAAIAGFCLLITRSLFPAPPSMRGGKPTIPKAV